MGPARGGRGGASSWGRGGGGASSWGGGAGLSLWPASPSRNHLLQLLLKRGPRPCLGGPRGRAGSLLPPSTWWSAGGSPSGSECSCNPSTDTAAQVLFYSDDDQGCLVSSTGARPWAGSPRTFLSRGPTRPPEPAAGAQGSGRALLTRPECWLGWGWIRTGGPALPPPRAGQGGLPGGRGGRAGPRAGQGGAGVLGLLVARAGAWVGLSHLLLARTYVWKGWGWGQQCPFPTSLRPSQIWPLGLWLPLPAPSGLSGQEMAPASGVLGYQRGTLWVGRSQGPRHSHEPSCSSRKEICSLRESMRSSCRREWARRLPGSGSPCSRAREARL